MTGVMRLWVTRPIVARPARKARIGALALALAISGAAGCAANATPPAASPDGASPVESNQPAGPPAAGAPAASNAPASTATAATLPPRRRLPEIVLDPKQPMRALPELKVENIGLHVGGGPNDAETKAPFLNAIAERFPAFMDCYRKNEDPALGGRFGVDLHIGRAGGHPHLEQPRTSLRGPEFRSCLSTAFESVDFKKPKLGPTTISYSLRFTLVEAP